MKFKHGSFAEFFFGIGWKMLLIVLFCLSVTIGGYAIIIYLAKVIWKA